MQSIGHTEEDSNARPRNYTQSSTLKCKQRCDSQCNGGCRSVRGDMADLGAEYAGRRTSAAEAFGGPPFTGHQAAG